MNLKRLIYSMLFADHLLIRRNNGRAFDVFLDLYWKIFLFDYRYLEQIHHH